MTINKPIPQLTNLDIYRFWTFVQKSDKCWNWLGNCGISSKKEERPSFYAIGRMFYASRIVWKIVTGNDPGEMLVLHICNNIKCVKPSHLYLGTKSENEKDKHDDNPYLFAGSKCSKAKLNEEDIIKIREECMVKSVRQLADEYNISYSGMYDIVNRRNWRHI